MNNNHFIPIPFSLYTTLFIITSILFPRKALCVDFHFLSCNPKRCGGDGENGGPNISFPFYIQDEQESYCGYPCFNVTCQNNFTILKLFDTDYIIHRIFYQNQSLILSNAAFHNASSCFPPIRNLSFPEDRFTLPSDQTRVLLFYGCNSSVVNQTQLFKHKIDGCLGGDSNETALAMFGDDPLLGNASDVCEREAIVPVGKRGRFGGEVRRAVQSGFVMNWIASNCSICEKSGGKCGFDETLYHFQCFCPDRPHAWKCSSNGAERRRKLAIGLGVGFPVIVIILLSSFFFRNRYKRKPASSANSSPSHSSKEDMDEGSIYCGVPIFSYSDLEEATNHFDSGKELGDGGFGTVYYGKLRDGREVAVKRLYEHNYRRLEQFLNEIKILTLLHHKNLVSLYGCTSRRSRDLLLVYEYIPNGTVADHLHGDRAKSSPLSWPLRMSIAIETATALAYLHASEIIHRDVKTNNILLDNNFCVKVADFGLSRLVPNDVTHVSTAPQGTPGYVDPEYHKCYQLTDKSDVYSFGVVLIELVSSMPAVDISRHRDEINLANLAMSKIQKCAFEDLIDKCLGYKSDEEVKRMTTSVAELAFRCLQQDKETRPSMVEVLAELMRIENGESNENEKHHDDDGGNDDDGSIKRLPPPSPPDCDQAALLKNIRLPNSPDSVTDKWVSRSSSHTTTRTASG